MYIETRYVMDIRLLFYPTCHIVFHTFNLHYRGVAYPEHRFRERSQDQHNLGRLQGKLPTGITKGEDGRKRNWLWYLREPRQATEAVQLARRFSTLTIARL